MVKQEKFFLEALETKDIKEIRKAICLYIDKDATDLNGELKDAIEIIKRRGISIWEPHKVIEAVKPKSEWNEFYLGVLQADLMYNFSKERLDLILEVANHIYANEKYVKKAKLNQEQSSTITHKMSDSSSMDKKVRHEKTTGISQQTQSQRKYSTSIKNQPGSATIKSNQPLSTDAQKNIHQKYQHKSQEMKKRHSQNKDLLTCIVIGAGVISLVTAAYFMSSK